MYSKIVTLGSLLVASAIAAKDPFYVAKCQMDSTVGIKGSIVMKQKGTIDDEGEPVRIMKARIQGVPDGVEAISLDLFDENPMDVQDQDPQQSLGEWFTNRKNSVAFGNMRRDDLCLKNDDPDMTLDGKFIGVTCLESGNLVGCCEIKVSQRGDHGDDGDDEIAIQQLLHGGH